MKSKFWFIKMFFLQRGEGGREMVVAKRVCKEGGGNKMIKISV